MLKKAKALAAVVLVLVMLCAAVIPAGAEAVVKFTAEQAKEVAVDAAKTEMLSRGVDESYVDACCATYCVYDSDTSTYTITVRAAFTYCYKCTVVVTETIGIEHGRLNGGTLSQTNMAVGYINNLFEVIQTYLFWVFKNLPQNLKSLIPE